jgi:hypothetical protein
LSLLDETKIERASYGITPFKGASREREDISFDDPYYASPRYAQFLSHLEQAATDFEVSVESHRRALGLWEGTNEPSAAIDVTGVRENIEAVARSTGKQFDQWAVRVIYQPGNGQHRMYSYDLGDKTPHEVMEALTLAGVAGARVTDSHIELADVEEPELQAQVILEQMFGSPIIIPCEVVRVIN